MAHPAPPASGQQSVNGTTSQPPVNGTAAHQLAPTGQRDFADTAVNSKSEHSDSTEKHPDSTKSFTRPHMRDRAKTNLDEVEIANRGFSHKYLIRQPRALQYSYNGQLVKLESNDHESFAAPDNHVEGAALRSTDNAALQRSRLDLFIDVIWVGIIGNLAEYYTKLAFESDTEGIQYSDAILAYIVLFIPVLKIWNSLRDFLNNFFMDDFVQRVFVTWIMILMLVFGNTATFFLSVEDGHVVASGAKYIVSIYLIARASFLTIELFYSLAISWLRKLALVSWLLILPGAALWIGGIFVEWRSQAALFIVAALVDTSVAFFLSSPASDFLLSKGYRRAYDDNHLIDRLGTFYVIFIGAGVFLLIFGSPAGNGITLQVGSAILALVALYVLNWIYFNAAQDLRFVHAVKRVWWRRALWLTLHIPLFGSILIFGTSLRFLVIYGYYQAPPEATEGGDQHHARALVGRGISMAMSSLAARAEAETHEPTATTIHTARWSVSVSLSIALAAMTGLALLNRSLDKPGTLLVNNRYIRLIGRPVVVAIVLGVSSYDRFYSANFIAIIMGCLWALLIFETCVGRVRGGGIWEPWRKRMHGVDTP